MKRGEGQFRHPSGKIVREWLRYIVPVRNIEYDRVGIE